MALKAIPIMAVVLDVFRIRLEHKKHKLNLVFLQKNIDLKKYWKC
jgi:hypothetical protein